MQVLKRAGETLPRFDFADHDSSRFSSLSSLHNYLSQLRLMTIILAERVYADFQFKKDESERKKLIKDILSAAYMKDESSDRKNKLIRWANTT
jgi:hypothetical protein